VTRRPRLVATVLGVLLATACGGEGSGDAAPTEAATSEVTASTEPPEFDGDPDSEFCQRSRQAADEPVLDPFEAGLEPREVELRFRALTQRFEGFAEISPEPLADDLTLLDETFQDLAVLLDDADYDFARLAEGGADVSVFDDPTLAVVADRLAAYQNQVCER
jgi:hypothetical protein